MQAYKPQHTGAAALVLRALKAMGCATKQQLAQATGLSVMAAGTAVEHLMEKGRVLVRGRAAATGTRASHRETRLEASGTSVSPAPRMMPFSTYISENRK